MPRASLSAGLVLLLAGIASATHPSPPSGFEASLIGLLEVPLVYDALEHAGPKPPTPSRIDARTAPSRAAPVVATLHRDGITTRDGARCFWQRAPHCRFHEAGYEEPALAVFERRVTRAMDAEATWYRIAIDADGRRFGWIQSATRFLDLTALVVTTERLTYLTPAWRGQLFDRPDAGRSRPAAPARAPQPERAVRALRPAMVGGRLWIEVELYDGACDGEERVVDKGWVPLRDAAGALLVWYWSRGC